ncbi:MAG: GvpL/GvpF family gas vesicle protein [Thermoleophilaceae bacterium]
MQALARRQRRSEEAAALLEPLERVADAAVKRESAADDLTRWAFLIERGRVEDFNARLDDLRSSHPELRMTCTGPWPPYSFVSEER